MNYIEHFYTFLHNNKIFYEFFIELYKQCKTVNTNYKPSDFIRESFTYSYTDKGHSYWTNVHFKWGLYLYHISDDIDIRIDYLKSLYDWSHIPENETCCHTNIYKLAKVYFEEDIKVLEGVVINANHSIKIFEILNKKYLNY